jgi:glyoxylase-like metal-dependent hydrolase (beta-lactamase superfamily II)
VFTGDTLFKVGIGRYDFSYSKKSDLEKSLRKILKLAGETVVYPGHGDKTTIVDEKEFVYSII